MRIPKSLFWALVGLLIFQTHGSAISIFSDDFNAESPPSDLDVLNYNAFAQWNVTDGTVDLIAPNNQWGLTAIDGKFVDLDGSTGSAGVMTTKNAFNFIAGTTYALEFDLRGNERGYPDDTVDVLVSLGTLVSDQLILASADPWTHHRIQFVPGTTTLGSLSFGNQGGDNVGALLDNVSISTVPEAGATLAFLGLGLLGIGAVRRRLG